MDEAERAPAEAERVPAAGDRPAAGRGAPAERMRAGRRPNPPLLARPDLGQLDLAGLAGDAPARIAAVARSGLREYYDPRNGRGLGAREFAWSALMAELADPRSSLPTDSAG